MKQSLKRKHVKETIQVRRKVLADLRKLNSEQTITSAQSSSIIYVNLDSDRKREVNLPEYSYDKDYTSDSYITFYAKGQAFTICLA